MKTKKLLTPFSYLVAVLALSFAVVSCEKDKPVVPESDGTVFVLNNGSWGNNNANVGIYDSKNKSFSGDMFASANSVALGDLGQDMAVCGDDVFIAVNGSQLIFVTDKNLKIKHRIVATEGDVTLSPRYLTVAGGKVYVTYYEGFLGEIDPAKSYSVRTTAVGPNPEGLAYVNGKLYVANSGGYVPGYDNTLSVVDASTFKETSRITVNTNPCTVKSCGNYLYVYSYGNYADIPAKLQSVDIKTLKVSDLDYESVSGIAMAGRSLYVLCGGYDASWALGPGSVYEHNAYDNTKLGKLISDSDANAPQHAYSISAAEGYIFVGGSDFVTNGTVYVYESDGKPYDVFDSEGVNPIFCVSAIDLE